MNSRDVLETFGLYGTGGDDALTDGGAALGFLFFVQLTDGHGRHLDVDVDAVHQGAADFVKVALDGTRWAGAFDGRVVVVAARAGIHGGDKHKGGRVVDGHLCPRDGHTAFLHRLSKYLQHSSFEFW